jgi:hypothetical protein
VDSVASLLKADRPGQPMRSPLGCSSCIWRPNTAIKSSSSSMWLKVSPQVNSSCTWSELRPTASLAFLYGVSWDESYLNS